MALRYLDADKVTLPNRAPLFVEKGHCQLAEDSLFLKACFQHLDSLFFGREDMVMPNTRQGHQVFRSVVIFDAIQMMYYPAFRQCFVVCHFPIENMLTHIASFLSSWMVRLQHINIPLLVNSASFPIRMLSSSTHTAGTVTAIPPLEFESATPAASRFSVDGLATIDTSFPILLEQLFLHIPIVSRYRLTMQGVQQ